MTSSLEFCLRKPKRHKIFRNYPEFPNSRNTIQSKRKNWSQAAELLIMLQSDWLKFEIEN